MRLTPPAATLRQLQYAVAIAETRNFHRAAALCHVSQPSLSAQVAELEGALGVRLFERDRKQVLLTAAGRELVDRARRVLLEMADLTEVATRFGDPLSGTLRFGIIPTISPYLLPEVVPVLRRRFPRLSLQWVEEKTTTLVALVQAGSLDAAVVALEADLGDLEREILGRDPFVLVAPRLHPLGRSRAAVGLDDLRGSTVLLLDDGHCFRDQALAVCSASEAQEPGFRATSLSTLAQMVAGGAGITLLPRLAVRAENRGAHLVVRRFVDPAPHRTLALAWRRRSPLAAALGQVSVTLREAYARAEPKLEAALGRRFSRGAASPRLSDPLALPSAGARTAALSPSKGERGMAGRRRRRGRGRA
ncbi:MAG TPA: LysR substrate-binding domain-containing protein [Candidatus Deferrimicrobiaceae bacterium]|nr:LysR substrate-binding domain-containing protein [Candidatus Deferrimicrobiaceae bacterium]